MSYSYNVFESACFSNISTSEQFFTSLILPQAVPAGGHAVILSVIACNKSTTNIHPVSLAIQKVDFSTNCMVCKEVPVPIATFTDLLGGTKLVLNREDQFKAWTSSLGANRIDLTISYAIYTPASV